MIKKGKKFTSDSSNSRKTNNYEHKKSIYDFNKKKNMPYYKVTHRILT